jgi:hypothetical protein
VAWPGRPPSAVEAPPPGGSRAVAATAESLLKLTVAWISSSVSRIDASPIAEISHGSFFRINYRAGADRNDYWRFSSTASAEIVMLGGKMHGRMYKEWR